MYYLDANTTIKQFNHYFSNSSRWKYEEVIDDDYCYECAVDNVYERYNNGELIDEYEDEE